MQDASELVAIATKYLSLAPLMDERMRRQWAATEARTYGWGGVRALSSVIGMSPNTIKKGLSEWSRREETPQMPLPSRLRAEGGGRKRCTEVDPELVLALEHLVDPVTRGDPESPLRWTCKSTTHLATALTEQGHTVSPRTVGRLLNADGYSLQSNRKTKEGEDHPDRNAQIEHINQGWVSVGIDHDTARFAAEAIRRWWRKMGSKRYRDAKELLITADGGGSNGSRSRLWKVALHELAISLSFSGALTHLSPNRFGLERAMRPLLNVPVKRQ